MSYYIYSNWTDTTRNTTYIVQSQYLFVAVMCTEIYLCNIVNSVSY